MTTATVNTVHPFERAGLGLAPFKYVGMSVEVGPRVMILDGMRCEVGAPGQPMGSCAYCGQGIKFVCHILSADGKRFTVGCDCVAKIGRADNRLSPIVTEVERWKKEQAREKREAKRAAQWTIDLARVNAARDVLDASPALLTDMPHPRAWDGKTARDWAVWMLANAGMTGRLDAARLIEAKAAEVSK